jgi:DNA-binding PadR family transcriptional regulator
MRPMSGYDLKKLFDMSASYFWPADQTQIYRTLKKLVKEGLIELKEQKKGVTVDKKVYAITDKGRAENLNLLQQNTVDDFISRDLFLMQLFFSGALSREERLRFLNAQLENINVLKQRFLDNYEENYKHFLSSTGLTEDDPRLRSIDWTYQWELIKCQEYIKLLKRYKAEIREAEEYRR